MHFFLLKYEMSTTLLFLQLSTIMLSILLFLFFNKGVIFIIFFFKKVIFLNENINDRNESKIINVLQRGKRFRSVRKDAGPTGP